MRRLLTVLFAAALAAGACSSSGHSGGATATTTVGAKPVPAALRSFLGRVRPQGAVDITAIYRVTRKLGGGETVVRVVQTASRWTITAGDQTVSGPPAPSSATEAKLFSLGIASSFYSSGPANALRADSTRSTAGAPVFSERTSAGIALDCASVPQAGVESQTACLTPEGVFGYVDNPAVLIELVSYSATATR